MTLAELKTEIRNHFWGFVAAIIILAPTVWWIADKFFGERIDVLKEKNEFLDKERSVLLERLGKETVHDQLTQMRVDIKSAAESIGENGRYKVSTDVIQLRDVDRYVITKIEGRKEAIKRIIWTTAADIEAGRNIGISFEGTRIELSTRERERVDRLNKAIQNNNVSISSLALSIKMVVAISGTLYNNASSETDPKRKFDLYVEYTAFAYELSSIVIELLETYRQEGADELRELYAERDLEIDQLKGRINNALSNYKTQLDSGMVTQEEYDKKFKTYNDLLAALDVSLKSWQKIFDILDNQKNYSEKLRSKVNIFRRLRDDAGLQILVLREIGIAQEISFYFKNNDIEDIAEIAQVPLLQINADLAKELLGLNIRLDAEESNKGRED